ncbi:unnamed protein product [Paramecium sonneborni]|uniref:SP-RING-type domain-containing protein n=1 Tax=Paramecium sonneborni TaxID=65129 RepID=A0A8S1KDY7_9CILI|nr:unnamed protein product [Paramecium sonneborni]CAD8051004.1 unnamed protein product [Paramecium sonneborni]
MLEIKRGNQRNEIKVEKSKTSLICQYSFKLIRTPVRGEFCYHQQCFCLNSYLEMMKSAEHRKWVCPICKKVCLNLIIDKSQKLILDIVRELKLKVEYVTLNNNGSLDKDDVLYKIILEKDQIRNGLIELNGTINEIDVNSEIGYEVEQIEDRNEAEIIICD